MELPCIHCGQRFSVRDDQLGGRGRCPHCRGEIVLPKASCGESERKAAPAAPFHWLENSISGLASIIFHTALFLALALFEFGHIGGEGEGTDVLIGALPSEKMSNSMSGELSGEEEAKKEETSTELDEMLEIQYPSATTDSALDENLIVASPSRSGGEAGSFDLGEVTIGGGGS